MTQPPPGAASITLTSPERAAHAASYLAPEQQSSEDLVVRLQDSFSLKVNGEKPVKNNKLRGSQRFSNHLANSMISD